MPAATLYIGNRNYSSWSLRAALMLAQSRIPHETVVIPLDRGDTAARIGACSPSGRVPVLHHGDTVVWESLAIGEYLAELAPQAGLWPAGASARAMARSVSAEMHAGFPALRQALPMDMRARRGRPQWSGAVQADIDRVTAVWTRCRALHGGEGPYLFGTFCMADAMFAPVASRFMTYDVPVAGVASAYRDAVLAWPATVAWMAQAAAEPWVLDDP